MHHNHGHAANYFENELSKFRNDFHELPEIYLSMQPLC